VVLSGKRRSPEAANPEVDGLVSGEEITSFKADHHYPWMCHDKAMAKVVVRERQKRRGDVAGARIRQQERVDSRRSSENSRDSCTLSARQSKAVLSKTRSLSFRSTDRPLV